ncbi:MAG: 23S rRNA (adenine(2030)-N(6))-methyltransferase RlmJ [Rhodomicrobium sp.]
MIGMNYRHIYHAGNFADVVKHIVLALCLDYLQRKDGGLCLLDAHGGAGLYALDSEEAEKTREWEKGIGRLWGRADAPADLALYLDLVKADLEAQSYPGSPLLMARRLRGQDRLIAAELHEPTFEALQAVLKPFKNLRAMHMDAYECVRAHMPPAERRGLVLIDPPFELKDEFMTLARQMREWKKRWPTGVYLIWYPIKAHLPVAVLKDAAQALDLRRTWCVEALIWPRDRPESLNGCGVIVFNAPYTVPERVDALLPYLKVAMSLHETASGWLVPGS